MKRGDGKPINRNLGMLSFRNSFVHTGTLIQLSVLNDIWKG